VCAYSMTFTTLSIQKIAHLEEEEKILKIAYK
jgi:hypothetical protein